MAEVTRNPQSQSQTQSQKLPDTCPVTQTSQPSQAEGWTAPEIPWGHLYSRNRRFKSMVMVNNEYKIGRMDVDQRLLNDEKSRLVSKTHFCLRRVLHQTDYVVYLDDLSFNGTFVNGRKIGKGNSVILGNNDEVALAYSHFKVFIYISSDLESDVQTYPSEIRENYAISRTLGSGACGEVKLIFEKTTGKAFAMKVIQKAKFRTNNGNKVNQIQREVDILKSLNHPLIIKFKDVVNSPEKVFIIVEYMEGGELFQRVVEGPLEEHIAKLYFLQLCIAIRYLHSEGIMHRDVKLENILLASNSGETLMKLSDFGLSKFLDAEAVMMTFCGTPMYIAPEVLKGGGRNGSYNMQADIWSMGVVLYMCLSGTAPFSQGDEDMPLREQIIRGDYGFPKTKWHFVSRKAKILIKKMLEVDPVKRITIDQILRDPWLLDRSVRMRLCRLMKPPAAVVKENEENEDTVVAKRPRLDSSVELEK